MKCVPGISAGPAERSESFCGSIDQFGGVAQPLSERSLLNLRMLSLNSVCPSYDPLPEIAYTAPVESAAKPEPDCQMEPPQPLGLAMKSALCWDRSEAL